MNCECTHIGENHYLHHRENHSKTWMTKSGQIVNIVDMKCSHIYHSIRLLERQKQEYTKGYDGLQAEWIRRQNSDNPCSDPTQSKSNVKKVLTGKPFTFKTTTTSRG